MEAMLILNHDEVVKQIPYALIAETRYGSAWNTGRCKNALQAAFTPKERKRVNHLCSKAYTWHLVSGVPDKVRMSPQTYLLWKRLGDVCASI